MNDVAQLIGQTQSMIQEKLRSTVSLFYPKRLIRELIRVRVWQASKTPSTVVALEQRVAKLERENQELEKRAYLDLLLVVALFVSAMNSFSLGVAALEKRFASQGAVAEVK